MILADQDANSKVVDDIADVDVPVVDSYNCSFDYFLTTWRQLGDSLGLLAKTLTRR